MNVLDFSIRLGKILRKTEEGKNLLQLEAEIKEKYKNNHYFHQYEQFAEQKATSYYFHSWSVAYQTFKNVLISDSLEHKELFLPTAELISSDGQIKEFVSAAVSFGNLFEKLINVIISGGDFKNVIPTSWKHKVKNAISDVQVAVERTLMVKVIYVFRQKNHNFLSNTATKSYLDDREKKHFLPFSQEALEMMEEAIDLPEEEKILYEKMHLIIEAVKKGTFYGFWGMVNEIDRDELITDDKLYGVPLSVHLMN